MRKVYLSTSKDPRVNLALEELLFQEASEDTEILFLWQNEKTVVIGRNQNPWKECNTEYLDRIGGTLVRRKSGGGAVFHDLGNLNFTFLSGYRQDAVIQNLGRVVKLLESFGVQAEFQGRNDLLVSGAKISGNAYYVENDKLCHHGTLLVNVDFDQLAKVLTVSHKKLESKGVDSVRSRVLNLASIHPEITITELIRRFTDLFLGQGQGFLPVVTLDQGVPGLSSRMEKYRSWDWNYGQSPGFDVAFNQRYSWGEVSASLEVKDGRINDLVVHTDAMEVTRAEEIKKGLTGMAYSPMFLDRALKDRFGE